MKFDRRSPRSWVIVAATAASIGIAVVISLAGRVVRWPAPRRRRVVLFSHLPSGNVEAFASGAPAPFRAGWDIRYLHIDPRRFREHRSPVATLIGLNPLHMLWVARSDVVMATHGPSMLRPLLTACPQLHFVDVWHGIGFVDRRRYVEEVRGFSLLLQPSEWTARFLEDLGVERSRIAVTGHGVWDRVLDPPPPEEILRELGVDDDGRPRVLVAPTWTHGRLWEQRDAFGVSWDDVAAALDDWAATRRAVVLFRSHLNAGAGLDRPLTNVRNVPFSRHPDTAAVLTVTDVLVTDWSSIANDFLPTGQPVLYLDVPPPFHVGHLDAGDRPGELVASLEGLITALDEAVAAPGSYLRRFESQRAAVAEKVCGTMADGHAVERYAAALDRLVPAR